MNAVESNVPQRTKRPWGELERARRAKDDAFYQDYSTFTALPVAVALLVRISLGEISPSPVPDMNQLLRALVEVSRSAEYDEIVKRSRPETYDTESMQAAILSATADQLHFAAGTFKKESNDLMVDAAIWQNPPMNKMEQAKRRKITHEYAMVLSNFRRNQEEAKARAE